MIMECDGSTYQETRNCSREAVWQVRVKDNGSNWVWSACNQHLGQVGTILLRGEQGELDIRRIRTEER